MNATKKTVLYEAQVKQQAKFISFAGFEMPVWFSNLKDEHQAVRTRSGLFDISHMGVVKLSGESAFDSLQPMITNDLTRCLDAKMIYSFILNENGMILDDVMIGHYQESYYLIVNASNKEKIQSWFEKKVPHLDWVDLNQGHVFLAVQGPQSVKVLSVLVGEDLEKWTRFGIGSVSLMGHSCVAMRTGYTGEDGFELIVANAVSEQVYDALISEGVRPCGLAARDTLRLEYGLPLYGQELSESIHPLMTRYQWAVKWDCPFIGKESLQALKEGEQWRTVGLTLSKRRIARTGSVIEEGGWVTSGALSPTLDTSIAMALVPEARAVLGTTLSVKVRHDVIPATVVPVPFLPKKS